MINLADAQKELDSILTEALKQHDLVQDIKGGIKEVFDQVDEIKEMCNKYKELSVIP